MNWLKKKIIKLKKILCRHKNHGMVRWHYVHPNSSIPVVIEIEYRCFDCGKLFYRWIDKDLKEFADKYKDKRW